MNVRLHDDLDEFVALAQPLLEADPVRHSIALTVLARLGQIPEISEDPLVLGRGSQAPAHPTRRRARGGARPITAVCIQTAG
ncbi:MAG TPA: hypothetical protein VJ757_14650 [Pseudonocardiaceae bacterium]|nr:hypothetical protein [Pseudonocardiaceae bacterium]